MRRTLSSLQTIPLKIFSPIVWIFALGLALNRVLGVFQSEEQPGKWIFLGFLVLYSLQTWECMRLKTIDVDDHNLYIGNFTKEISVPLSEILNVTPKGWPRWASGYDTSKIVVGIRQ